jgi:DNA-binding MarR family transcriptional regulator
MEALPFDISETARLIRREFDRRATLSGATRAQWRVLVRLTRLGNGAKQIELAEALDVEPISLSRMVDRLEQAGLVERRPDENDRRAWRVHLTEKSGPIIRKLQALGEQFQSDAIAGLSQAELATTQRVLEKIRHNLNEGCQAAVRKAS